MQSHEEVKLTRTTDERLNKARDECFSEAEKLIWSASPRTAYGYAARMLYKRCMENKGYP
jgi:hypothetical protein